MSEPRLYLVSAKKSRRSGDWSPDDYDVHDGAAAGAVIGRIYLSTSRQQGPWFWSISLFPASAAETGFAGTREEAIAKLKARCVGRRLGLR